jgi:hypothetical protein
VFISTVCAVVSSCDVPPPLAPAGNIISTFYSFTMPPFIDPISIGLAIGLGAGLGIGLPLLLTASATSSGK